jgi:hypothetical protein
MAARSAVIGNPNFLGHHFREPRTPFYARGAGRMQAKRRGLREGNEIFEKWQIALTIPYNWSRLWPIMANVRLR